MIPPELLPALGAFAEELAEQAQSVGASLVESGRVAEPEQRKKLLATVLRHLHTAKGNSGGLGFKQLEEEFHGLETDLAPFRQGQRAVPEPLVQKVLTRLDAGIALVKATIARKGVFPEEGVAAAGEPSSGEGLVGAVGDGQAGGQTIRVGLAPLAALDAKVEELKEVRVTLERRAAEARRLRAALEATTASADPAALSSLRALAEGLHRGLAADVTELAGRLTEAEDELRTLRTLPVDSIVPALDRSVWEHATAVGKKVRLRVTGAGVALDRRLLEELKGALTHVVRNAIDHGIEAPAARRAANKREEGELHLVFEHRGREVVVLAEDDGRGVDLAAVTARARERGLLPPGAPAPTAEQAHELLFTPGFSTAAQLTTTSGRGVGLDVVRESASQLGGRVTMTSVWGLGTRVQLELPLTLATVQVLLLETADHTLALPLVAVAGALYRPEGVERIDWNGQLLQVRPLAGLVGLGAESGTSASTVIVLRHADRLLCVSVDRVFGERDALIRPLPPELAGLRYLSSAASLGDGRLAFVLSPRALAAAAETVPLVQAARRRRRVVVADDSITTRMIHRQSLEAAGFEVETAFDGAEALRLLKARGADLLVSDVRMPRLDGLGLTRAVRGDAQLRGLPVVLVSSLDSDDDRRRATDAGASAYVTKQEYEKGVLLATVRSLVDA